MVDSKFAVCNAMFVNISCYKTICSYFLFFSHIVVINVFHKQAKAMPNDVDSIGAVIGVESLFYCVLFAAI